MGVDTGFRGSHQDAAMPPPSADHACMEDRDPHPCPEDEDFFECRPDAADMEEAIGKFMEGMENIRVHTCTYVYIPVHTSTYWYILYHVCFAVLKTPILCRTPSLWSHSILTTLRMTHWQLMSLSRTVGMLVPSSSSPATFVQLVQDHPRIHHTKSAQMTCCSNWSSSAPLRSCTCPSMGRWRMLK